VCGGDTSRRWDFGGGGADRRGLRWNPGDGGAARRRLRRDSPPLGGAERRRRWDSGGRLAAARRRRRRRRWRDSGGGDCLVSEVLKIVTNRIQIRICKLFDSWSWDGVGGGEGGVAMSAARGSHHWKFVKP
jgi:hypothetical protein